MKTSKIQHDRKENRLHCIQTFTFYIDQAKLERRYYKPRSEYRWIFVHLETDHKPQWCSIGENTHYVLYIQWTTAIYGSLNQGYALWLTHQSPLFNCNVVRLKTTAYMWMRVESGKCGVKLHVWNLKHSFLIMNHSCVLTDCGSKIWPYTMPCMAHSRPL